MLFYMNIVNYQNIEYILLSAILWVTLSFNQSIHIWACYISHLTYDFVMRNCVQSFKISVKMCLAPQCSLFAINVYYLIRQK